MLNQLFRGKGKVLLLIVAVLALGAAAYFYLARASSKEASHDDAKGRRGGPPQSVQVSPAHIKDFEVWIDALGTVNSFTTVSVHSRVDGELVRINFKEGQMVKAGDVLAELDPRPFQIALNQALSLYAKDKAALENAKADLERYRDLIRKDAIPRQQLDTQITLVDQSIATLRNDEATIDSAKLNLVYARITAPISGRVGLRAVDPGNIVHAGDTAGLVTITELNPISVIFSVPQDLLPALQKAPPAHFEVKAMDRGGLNRLAEGKLFSMDNQVDATTGTIKLRAEFDNQSGSLFPNQFVNIRLRLSTEPKALVVPTPALQNGAQGSYVYTVTPEKKVVLKLVTTGASDKDETLIKSGLSAGELVVIDGADKLKDGGFVSVRTERSNPSSATPAQGPSVPDASTSSAPKAPAGDAPKPEWKHRHEDGSPPTPEERERWRQRHSSESKGTE